MTGVRAAGLLLAAAALAVACTGGSTTSSSIPGVEITDPAGRVEMPDVIGVPLPDAIRQVEDAGLSVTTIEIEDDDRLGEPGAEDVTRQDPEPGTLVADGSEVSLTVTAIPHSMPSSPAGSPAGTAWSLTRVDGRDVSGSEATLVFHDERRLGGVGGCNEYGARWKMLGERIEIMGFGSTMVSCDGTAGWVEDRLFLVLDASPVVEAGEDELRLMSTEGVLTFARIPRRGSSWEFDEG